MSVPHQGKMNFQCTAITAVRCSNVKPTCNQSSSTLPMKYFLVDDKLEIKISTLARNQKVTVYARMNEDGKGFESYGWFEADENGVVNLKVQESLSGTYTGISPMGIFWSMLQYQQQSDGMLMKKNVDTPLETHVYVYNGHRTLEDIKHRNQPELCRSEIYRWYKSPGVRRHEVSCGKIRGVLFLPPGNGPFPGVIDICGTSGGLIEYRSALLASRGLASLALPYFMYKDLPETWKSLNLDYFLEAVDWLSSQKNIISNGVGVFGSSKAGDIALMIGAHSPKVRAIVNINGCSFNALVPMKYSGGDIPEIPFQADRCQIIDGKYATRNSLDYSASDIIPVWRNNAKLLNILSEDDQCHPTESLWMMRDLYPVDKKENCIVVPYPGAGHLVEPPYTPLCSSSYHKVIGLHFLWGGRPEPHAFAQEDSWRKILNFFHKELTLADPKL